MEDLFKIIVVLCLDTLALLIGFMWIHTIGIGGSATLEYSEDLKAESNSESKGNNEFNDALKNCVSQG